MTHPFEEIPLQELLHKYNVPRAEVTMCCGNFQLTEEVVGQEILDEQAHANAREKGIRKHLEGRKSLYEMASLSKSVGSCFAIEYFEKKNIPLKTKVNAFLSTLPTKFRLKSEEGKPPEWADEVDISHLMSHCALNMHYVNGVPADRKFPPITEFLEGNRELDLPAIRVINQPGTVFQYSGAGFIVLQYLIELHSGKSIPEITRPWLDELGMPHFTFEPNDVEGYNYPTGHRDDGSIVSGGRKMFPTFAAGAMSTTEDMMTFLKALGQAYHSPSGYRCISHSTALAMLKGTDKGCRAFMNCDMGLGIFLCEAGPNQCVVHQGANDGFRVIFFYCFSGPNKGCGFVSCATTDLRGVFFNAVVGQRVLLATMFKGVDFSKFVTDFDWYGLKQEEIVNRGYKELMFNAFLPSVKSVGAANSDLIESDDEAEEKPFQSKEKLTQKFGSPQKMRPTAFTDGQT